MPGIVGIITPGPRDWAESRIRQMAATLCHDASYVTGTWIEAKSGIYIGWAVRRNSFCDAMPLQNETGEVSLFFAGEEYPDPDIRKDLRERGHAVKEGGPDYLVHLQEDRLDFPSTLNGRFHGFVHDRKRGQATLFNDRFSMNRVYYYQSEEAFYFAPEAKAILAACPETKSPNLQGLGEFVSCGCVLENRTLFDGINVLPAASIWSFREGAVERRSYFDAQEWEAQERLNPDEFYDQLRAVFSRNLNRYFNGRQPIGMSLTGGLDTRMIMAWRKFAPGSLPCYSFGGSYRDCEDVVLARKVAAMCGQPHEVIPVGADFLSRFAHYAERAIYLTDGTVEVNRASDLFVNERAREIAPVRMTGNYGSEVLRWVPAFKPGEPTDGIYNDDFLPHVRATRDAYARIAVGHPVSFAVFRQAPWHHYGLLGLEQTQLTVRTPFLDNDFVRTAFQAPNPAFARNGPANNEACLRLIEEGNKELGALRTDRGLGFGQQTLSGKLLHEYLEFTFKAEYAYDYGMPQTVARVDHLLSGLHLERLFLGRHKFAHYRVWYRDDLSSYLQQILLDPKALNRPYLRANNVETIVRRHVKGTHNYTSAIHKLLTLELTNRLFFDS